MKNVRHNRDPNEKYAPQRGSYGKMCDTSSFLTCADKYGIPSMTTHRVNVPFEFRMYARLNFNKTCYAETINIPEKSRTTFR